MVPIAIGTNGTSLQSQTQSRPQADQVRAAIASFPVCLVTGGAGYIGSHTVLELLTAGLAVIVVDNLCNSHLESLCRVYAIAKTEFEKVELGSRPVPPIFFHKVDIRDAKRLNQVFSFWQDEKATLEPNWMPIDVAQMTAKRTYPMLDYSIDPAKRSQITPLALQPASHGRISSVIHFAALKAVGESLSKPLDYYETNVTGLLNLLKAVQSGGVGIFVFSSSAVVYGKGHEAGITEETVQVAGQGNGGGLLTNPYGRSKWMSEEIINDYCLANPEFHATSLRYFNPTGSHPSGLIGEDPKGTPNNIVPVIMQAYERRRSRVHVFGSSYDTADGTGVRDYIHVSDLAKGHLAALRKATSSPSEKTDMTTSSLDPASNYNVYNLGTGRGYSVLEIIKAFSTAAGSDIPFAISDPRPGDLGTVTASADKAATELDWRAEFDIQDMCRDVFNWASSNPGGYEKLRRMSTMSVSDANTLRKASIASGLFEDGVDFDSFMNNKTTSTFIRKLSMSMSNARKMSRGHAYSFSSNVSDEDKSVMGTSPTSAAESGKVSRFNMSWADNQRRPLGLAIKEEDDNGMGPGETIRLHGQTIVV
ncbi:hypothetical protein MBLNU457_3345t1 [Dothideomycetes sp. NU457]